MKNLLLVLAILMLGCGPDTEVVEEPPPVDEEPDTQVSVVHEIGPTPKGDRGDIGPPRIIESNVYPQHERVSFNADRLNREGISFEFNEDLHRFVIDLSLDGVSLGWTTNMIRPGNNMGISITLIPPAKGPFLERRKKYLIDLFAVDNTGEVLELEIWFWTIP